MFKVNDKVIHEELGEGSVISVLPDSLIVRFEKGNLEQCPFCDIKKIGDKEDLFKESNETDADTVITKIQSALIQSINNKWGVFSRSSIDLLPHQLWVCNKVLKKWPVRYLVADDVGLGKTIEAGLIIWSLKTARQINRILILTPAPLTYQWQERMKKLFDLNFDVYTTEHEKEKINYWDGHNAVIASFPTLQVNNNDRQTKLLDSEAWDLVIVDEAHHMYASEQSGTTLQYNFFEKLEKAGKVISTILFTGTPHRGFDYGFWALMKLVAPDEFSPKKSSEEQYKKLKEYFIRNNKEDTVDMSGNKLFKTLNPKPYTFSYYPEEAEFYIQMSQFILNGKAYANTLSGKICTQVNLVLIALQKLASSSIAAVTSALITRKENLKNVNTVVEDTDLRLALNSCSEDEETANLNNLSFTLMDDEIQNLDILINLGKKVTHESRIDKIIKIIEENYPEENILFFTEYKKTQSLLLTELMKKWGEDCVTFINGDEKLTNVVMPNGSKKNISITRTQAADMFNEGKKRFLISTEAAGEGIDLQKNCHVLLHVDLPWNPMRLHQRVGRINRYGQKFSVDVITLRNPKTVEANIWDKLTIKLDNIQKAFSQGMDNPEDISYLVLGMAGENYFQNIFSEGISNNIDEAKMDDWFDAKTQTFGGKSAISTIKNLLGNVDKFNVSGLPDVPKVDLPDLVPFFKQVLKMNNRQLSVNNDSYSFLTPQSWIKGVYGAKTRYSNLIFRRKLNDDENPINICGVGHWVFNKCLEYADTINATSACIGGDKSYFIYKLYEQKTYSKERITQDYIFIEFDVVSDKVNVVSLDKALKLLNSLKKIKKDTKYLNYIPSSVEELAKKEMDNYHYVLPKCEIKFMLLGNI